MSLTSLDQLITAMAAASSQTLYFSKSGKASQSAGGYSSNWNGAGTPGAGAVPGAAENPTNATAGALAFNNPAGGLKSYLARGAISVNVSGAAMRIYDRLGQMGGLSGTVTTAQSVSLSVTGTGNNLPARLGRADYADVQWYLEWYTDTGSTAVTATVSYTDANGVSGKTVAVSMAATMRSGRMLAIEPADGVAIRSVESVRLSASTGTAGNFGVTAGRLIVELPGGLASTTTVQDWAAIGLPIIADSACLAIMCINPGASGVTFTGSLLMVHG